MSASQPPGYPPAPPPPPPGPPGGYGSQPPGGYGTPPPGVPGQYPSAPQGKPDNYLVWAILTTIFCCLPFGIVAIVKSSKVDGLWSSGQYAEAQAASADAKKWSIIAAIVGVVAGILYALFYILVFAAASTNGY